MSRPPVCCLAPALRPALATLLTRGACLLFSSPTLPVPIPLNEVTLLGDTRLLWATCHTPFGTARPLVGQLAFDRWTHLDSPGAGCAFLDDSGRELARIVPHTALGLPHTRMQRLRQADAAHRRRAARDPNYARRWSRSFSQAAT